jgi:methionyl-tRNA synthetase
MKQRLVTSALPYINNVPHLGNLIQVLSADCFAHFCRLRGYKTLYVCGTDEYGTATETRAAEEGITPRELCDRFYTIHSDIYKWFNIRFDKFGRTSTPIQTEIVQEIFKKLDEQGFIVERTIEQLHCEKCNRFLADRYVRGTCPHCGFDDARGDQCENCGKLLDPTELKEPRCSSCGSSPKLESTKHLYINLPEVKDRLEAWIKEASVKGFWANNAIQMTQAWIRDGLRERAITRDLKWGIPVPKAGFENKVFYVWFDAPIGYVSITGNLGAEQNGGDWRGFTDSWWKNPDETELFQFIGKDNIPFHTVIFPSSLLGTGEKWTMLHHMSSTEYLNYESGKFSKSRGIGVFGTDVMETGISADTWRFYIFYNRPEKSDSLFTWKDFAEKVNGELIGNLGNLVNRTLSFVSRYYDGKIPLDHQSDSAFWKTVAEYEEKIASHLERAELRDAFRIIFELSSFANKTFQDGEPWKTRKDNPAAAEALISDLSFLVRDIGIMIQPYMPAAAEKIVSFFGQSIGKDGLSWKDLGNVDGIKTVTNPEVLFAKLEDDHINELRERYSGSQKEREERTAAAVKAIAKADSAKSNTKAGTTMENTSKEQEKSAPAAVEADDIRFAKTIHLRTAVIKNVERHPQADKLYIIGLDIDGEDRTIVSGLVGHYTEEQLLGKHIIVAYNLKKAKLRGVESHGMLLAASDKDVDGNERVEVLDVADIPSGTRVMIEGSEIGDTPEQITIDTFFSIPIKVEENIVFVNGKKLTLNGNPIKTAMIPVGEVG